jgi:hypothetical protein
MESPFRHERHVEDEGLHRERRLEDAPFRQLRRLERDPFKEHHIHHFGGEDPMSGTSPEDDVMHQRVAERYTERLSASMVADRFLIAYAPSGLSGMGEPSSPAHNLQWASTIARNIAGSATSAEELLTSTLNGTQLIKMSPEIEEAARKLHSIAEELQQVSTTLHAALSSVKVAAASGAAEIILQQLGGGRFIAMTGAKNLISDKNMLRFRVPHAANGINMVEVTLDPSDTYTMKFMRVRGMDAKVVKEIEGVYGDNIQQIFTDATKLHTRLASEPGFEQVDAAKKKLWEASEGDADVTDKEDLKGKLIKALESHDFQDSAVKKEFRRVLQSL